MLKHRSWPDRARLALAAIRIFNGGVALVAPALLARRLGVDPKTSPATLYVFRMFGIRTVLVGLELLRRDDAIRAKALRDAPLIHASDTLAAFLAGRGGVPKSSAISIVAISALNTTLAVLAQGGKGAATVGMVGKQS